MIRKYVFLLVVVGFFVYFNSLFNGFVWDDEEQVLNNNFVHSISSIPQLFLGSTFNTGGTGSLAGMYYKPLMSSSFAFIYSIFGAHAFFFHFFQLSLHILNGVLVFYLLKRFFKENISFFLALIFLIHPINSETVNYISALQDVLFFNFGLLAFYFDKKKVLSGVLLLLSLLSKETGLLFVIIFPLYYLSFERKSFKYSLITSAAAIGIYSFLRFVVAGVYLSSSGPSPIMRASFFERIITAPQIAFYYIKTFLFPIDLSIAQHWVIKEVNFINFYLPLFLVVTLFIFLLTRSKSKQFIFFFIWALLGLGFHLQVFPLDMTVAERWFYFPIVGFLGMIGATINNLRFSNQSERVFKALALLIIFLLSSRTMLRNFDWKDGLSLFSHDVNISQESFDLENNLGVELFRAKNLSEAEIHFSNSTKLAPFWWTNWNNLGVILERKGDYKTAKNYYQKAIDNGNYYLAYENLANILLLHESTQEAKIFTEDALKKLPQNSKLWVILAVSNYLIGEKEASLKAATNAYTLSPNQQTYYLYNNLLNNLPLELK